MNTVNNWIEHLHHPLVFAGFGLFIFALLLRPLFLNNSKLTGTATERLLHRGMILVFILALLAIIGGIALNWKATPEAAPKPVDKTTASEGIQQYEERLRVVEQQLLAVQASGTMTDDKERHLLEAQLKGVQEKLGNLQTSYEEELKRRKGADKALVEMKGQLPDARITAAKKSLEEGNTETAEQVFDEVVDKEGKSIALAAFQSGRLAEGRVSYAKAMRQYKKAVTLEVNNPDYLLAAGIMACTLADYDRAQEWLDRLLKLRKSEGKDDPNLGTVLKELARLYYFQGRYEESEPLYKHALKIMEKALGKKHSKVMIILDSLAVLYSSQGHYEKAESLYKRVLEIEEKLYGQKNAYFSASQSHLAALYLAQGRYEKAEPLYKNSLLIKEQLFGKESSYLTDTLNDLAVLYQKQGKYEKVEPLLRRALSIREKIYGNEHPHVATILHNLANLYRQQGRYEEAEALCLRDLSITKKKFGQNHPEVAHGLHNLARLYKSQGHYKEAEPLYQRAISIMKEKFPNGHPEIDRFQANYDDLKQKMAEQ
ncbi:MAG: tetratricopeptide repeat protein [Candidatus Electrothrix communis]|nr:MAG: tetratricopeptide repeat protein [Candidatus Electrothrix communis]